MPNENPLQSTPLTKETTSKLWNLDRKDFINGLLFTVACAVCTVIENSIEQNNFNFNWTNIWHVAVIAGVAYLSQKLGTASKTIIKMLIPIVLLLACSSTSIAQSIFKPVPKVRTKANVYSMSLTPTTQPDSLIWAFRPTVGAAYAYPGNLLMAGTGIGYKRLKWDYTTQKWKSQYSFNGILWAAGTTAPGPQVPAFSFGPAVGILNDLVLIGIAYDFTNQKWLFALSLSVSLNN